MATSALHFCLCLSSSHAQLFLSLTASKPMLFHVKKISASPTQEDHFAPEIEHAILGMQPRRLKNSSARSSWCHVRLCQLPGQTDRVPVGRPSLHKAINDHGALQANQLVPGRESRVGSITLCPESALPACLPPALPGPPLPTPP